MFTGKRFLTFLLAIAAKVLLQAASAQTLPLVLQQADSLLGRGDYYAALKLYDRVLFFDDSAYAFNSYEKIAQCYFINGQYEKAATYFGIAGKGARGDSLALSNFEKRTISLILGEQFLTAREELLEMPESYLQTQEGILLMALTMYGNQETEAAFMEFSKLKNLKSRNREIIRLKKRLERAERKNPKTAKILSMIIPGSGQIYAGDWRNGLNSLLLTGGLMTLGIYTISAAGFIDGIVMVGPWYQRYYTGGFKRAETSVNALKKKVRYEVLQEMLRMSSHEQQH